MVASALPASALGASCHAHKDVKPDDSTYSRVAIWCDTIQSDSKVQGELVRTGPLPNKFTSWFTDEWNTHYSPWGTAGESVDYEVAPR